MRSTSLRFSKSSKCNYKAATVPFDELDAWKIESVPVSLCLHNLSTTSGIKIVNCILLVGRSWAIFCNSKQAAPRDLQHSWRLPYMVVKHSWLYSSVYASLIYINPAYCTRNMYYYKYGWANLLSHMIKKR